MKDTQLKLVYHERKLSVPIRSPEDGYNFFIKVWDKTLLNLQEQVYLLYLNNNNETICWRCLGTGTCNECLIDIKLAVACGLQCLASKVIVAHNHPSGILLPSKQDLFITGKLFRAFALIDIKLLDHLVVCPSAFYSFREHRIKME